MVLKKIITIIFFAVVSPSIIAQVPSKNEKDTVIKSITAKRSSNLFFRTFDTSAFRIKIATRIEPQTKKRVIIQDSLRGLKSNEPKFLYKKPKN